MTSSYLYIHLYMSTGFFGVGFSLDLKMFKSSPPSAFGKIAPEISHKILGTLLELITWRSGGVDVSGCLYGLCFPWKFSEISKSFPRKITWRCRCGEVCVVLRLYRCVRCRCRVHSGSYLQRSESENSEKTLTLRPGGVGLLFVICTEFNIFFCNKFWTDDKKTE